MTKVKHAPSSLKRKKRTLKAMKGARGAVSKLLKTAKEAARKALVYNYSSRKKKKGDFRSLWITRITAACKEEGVSYSKFISGLKKSKIELNRKVLADLAATDNKAFKTLVKKSKV
ncbi:MAG: 50S ribosomal protein L20 [Candidatus Omnitrophota bacterium]|nr:50S ribosomal protein L20 [Candidatus Omnitrophota bacterium]MBU1894738.1 50S ribosomal protein L20 [Candidatus Omnitrophota bacterium]